MVLEWCKNGVKMAVQWCYSGVTVVYLLGHKGQRPGEDVHKVGQVVPSGQGRDRLRVCVV
jgi:hypothetical protein